MVWRTSGRPAYPWSPNDLQVCWVLLLRLLLFSTMLRIIIVGMFAHAPSVIRRQSSF